MKTNTLKANSPAKKKFALKYAKTDNGTEAARRAFPELAGENNRASLAVKASRLLRNDSVIQDIQLQKDRLQAIASKAVDRLDQIVEQGKEHNALQASQYVLDQVHGRATQTIQTRSEAVVISIDLTGTNTPQPAE